MATGMSSRSQSNKFIQDVKRRVRHIVRPNLVPPQQESFSHKEFDASVAFAYKTSEDIADFQSTQLKNILRLAIDKVPFYRRLKLNLDFEKQSGQELLKQFPIMTKRMMVERPEDFYAVDPKRAKVTWSHTSGSSGSPFHFIVPASSYGFENVTMARAWSMGGHYQPGDPVIMLRSYAPEPGQPRWRYAPEDNYTYLSAFDLNDTHLDEYLKIMNDTDAKILRGYPSSIFLLAELLERHQRTLPNIRAIVTSSETLLPHYRKTIERVFKLPVHDWYGLNERVVTVQQCEAGNYHNNDDYGYIEIGAEQHILGTSLFNTVMPFIRYDTNDVAELGAAPDACPCGRHLSIPFIGIQGRSDDLLYKADGTAIPTVNIYTAMHHISNVRQFKVIQDADYSLRLQVVSHQPLTEADRAEMRSALEQRLGPSVITIESVQAIPRNQRTGKIQTCESHIKSRTRRANRWVSNLQPYKLSSHTVWEVDPSKVKKLDWNESTIPPSPKVIEALRQLPERFTLNWYPDTHNQALLDALAQYADVPASCVQYFGGSDAAHEYIARAFLNPQDVVTLVSPTYDNFRVAAVAQGTSIDRYVLTRGESLDVQQLIAHAKSAGSDLLYIVNPNNPTGLVVHPEQIAELLEALPTTMLVLDEAYVEFGGKSASNLVERYPNVLITRTMSKAFGLASLRIGYILTQPENIELINRIRNAKLISAPAQIAALAALEDVAYTQRYVEQVEQAKQTFVNSLQQLGFEISCGGGNFVLIDLHDRLQKDACVLHLKEHQIFARDLGHLPSLETCIRITIGTPETMQPVIEAFTTWKSNPQSA